jgi:hypothetical protein
MVPEKPSAAQLIMAFLPPFYGTRHFITAFVKAQILNHTSRLILILLSHLHLVLLSTIFFSEFLTNILYVIMHYMLRPSHPPSFDHPYNIWWSVQTVKLLNMLVESKGFWRRCILLGITRYLDFVHRPVFQKLISETLCSLVFRIPDDGQSPKT